MIQQIGKSILKFWKNKYNIKKKKIKKKKKKTKEGKKDTMKKWRKK